MASQEGPPRSAPSRNPLPLSASQEAQVRDLYHARVRAQCAAEIQAFAACALGRTFSVSFACRAEHRAMNACMKLHATQREHDAAREEWFARRLDRRRQRDHRARVAAAQEDFIRDWWGLPDDARPARQRHADPHAGVGPGGARPGGADAS